MTRPTLLDFRIAKRNNTAKKVNLIHTSRLSTVRPVHSQSEQTKGSGKFSKFISRSFSYRYIFFIKLNSCRRFVGRRESSLSSDVDFFFFVAVKMSNCRRSLPTIAALATVVLPPLTHKFLLLQLHAHFINIKCVNVCRDLEEVFGALTLCSPYIL